MKNIFFILSLLFCTYAYATKARVIALANSPQFVDEQYIFSNINQINSLGRFVSFETGLSTVNATTTSTLSNAEGMLGVKLGDDDTVVVAVGHQDEAIIGSRVLASRLGNDFSRQQNPLYVLWGRKGELNSYGVGLFYSNYRDKVSGEAESSSGVSLGLTMGAWRYYAVFTAVNSAETAANAKFNGAGYLSANVDYGGDTTQFYLRFVRSVEKVTTSGTENSSNLIQTVRLGLTDSTYKDSSTYFWGSEVVSTSVDCRVLGSVVCNKKYTSTVLPVWFGIEAQGTTWLVVRGSVKQTVFLNQSKDDVGYPTGTFPGTNGGVSENSAGTGTTVVSMGAGLALRNVIIDGLLTGSTTQNVNSANLLSQLSLKYTF